MRDFFTYLAIVWKNWESAMTGGILAVLLTVWGIFTSKVPPASLITGAIAVYFFSASYVAWWHERKRAVEAEKPKYSKQTAEFVRERMARLSDEEKRVVAFLAMGGKMDAIVAGREFKIEMSRGLPKISGSTRFLERQESDKEFGDSLYYISPAYLSAIQQYFIENPIK